jgi:hypothetical protein
MQCDHDNERENNAGFRHKECRQSNPLPVRFNRESLLPAHFGLPPARDWKVSQLADGNVGAT